MTWQYTPFVFPLFVSAAISVGLALYAWQRRPAVGARPFALLMLGIAGWSLVYALRLGSADLPSKLFWAKLRYLPIVIVPPAWLSFVLQYSGKGKWLTRRNVILISIVPAITLVLVWTNELHHLYWTQVGLIHIGPLAIWKAPHGPAFWAYAAYTYAMLLAGTFMLIQTLLRSPRLYRLQVILLLIGALAPLLADLLSTYNLTPFPLDLAPYGFTVAGLIIAWGIFRFRLFDIVPIARSAVVDSLSEGVFVLDTHHRIVDVNSTALHIIGRPVTEVVGQPMRHILADRSDLVARFRDVNEAQTEITLGAGRGQRSYELRISPVRDRRGQSIGRLIVLNDVTERQQAEASVMAQ